jgi:hypothetical protein
MTDLPNQMLPFGKNEKVKLFLCLTKHYAMKTYLEWMYRSTFPSPRYQLEVSGRLHISAALSPGKEPLVLIGREVEWTPEPVWGSNSDPSVVQPVARRYTDYATAITVIITITIINITRKRVMNLWATFNNRTGDILLTAALK